MYKIKYLRKALFICFVIGISNYYNAFGELSEIPCTSDYSNTCNQCFKEDSNLYLGYGRINLTDEWLAGYQGEYIFEDENPNPVVIEPFYKNGEIEKGPGKFNYTPNLTDKDTSNGEFFKDTDGSFYVDFNSKTRGNLIKSEPGFFIKFANLSEGVKTGGRNKPLYELKYIFNYYSKNDPTWTKKVHTECVLEYPAWCGDGVLDTTKEQCDYNAKPGDIGYNSNCTQECKIPTSNGSCVRGDIILPLTSEINQSTTGLCKPGENVTYFNSESPFSNIIDYTWECNGHLGNDCKATFYKDTNPSCDNLIGYPLGDVNVGTTSNLSCNGINGKDNTGYKIEVQKDGGGFTGITGTRNNNNNYTAQYKFSLPGKYNFRCLVGDETVVRDSCKNNNAINIISCGDGIKNGTEICDYNDISKSGWQNGNYCSTTCDYTTSSCINGGIVHDLSAPIDQNASGLCRSGETVSGFTSTSPTASSFSYSWSCNGNSGGNCNAVYSFGGAGRVPCGNGIRDNGEVCDFNDTHDRIGWQNGNYCSANCDYGSGGGGGGGGGGGPIIPLDWNILTNPGSCTGPRICPFTTPGEGTIDFGPNDNIIIGHNSNPFDDVLEKPYIINNTKHSFSGVEKLCVKYKSGNSLSYPPSYGTEGLVCIDMPSVFVPGQKVEFYNSPEFKGNKVNIPVSNDYGDNILTTTIQAKDQTSGKSRLYDNAYFAAKLNVRVSRPSVSTVGGGTSYVSDSSKVADLNEVTKGRDLDNNKNFVGTSVGTGQISSYSQSITKIDKENKISNSYSGSINKVGSGNTTTSDSTDTFSSFKNYNGLSNVFSIKNTGFEINSSNVSNFNTITEPTTYIIENGNLTINSDIKPTPNIAFIIKNGSITIGNSITELNGTYITIGGKFYGASSGKQLKVYGSLYGDISSLIDNRYYIKQNSNGQIDVGTIISFGSSIFRKTAPLTGEFIGEYLKSNKIAQ